LRRGGTATSFQGLRGQTIGPRSAPTPGGGAAPPGGGRTALEGRNDARTGVPGSLLPGAMCVRRFDDSLNSAIHITYRISLRSSSMPEPRDPLLKVLTSFSRRNQKTCSSLRK